MNYPKGLEQWIVEMLQGELDEEQRQKLESWLEEDPANRELLDKIREEKRWQGGIRQIAYFDDKMDWSAVLRTSFRRRRVIRMYRACAVAGIVLLLGVGGLVRDAKTGEAAGYYCTGATQAGDVDHGGG